MSLDEEMVVARIGRLTLHELRLWVSEGWLRPATGPAGPVFDEIDVARIRLLCDLRKDMALPVEALPVILTLIDRLNMTRRDLRHLADALEDQPPEVRRAIAESLRARRD